MINLSKQVNIISTCMYIAGIRAPPYRQCTFDRILVDAPCSGLGQRPQMVWDMTLQQLKSYPIYQRKLLNQVRSCMHLFCLSAKLTTPLLHGYYPKLIGCSPS